MGGACTDGMKASPMAAGPVPTCSVLVDGSACTQDGRDGICHAGSCCAGCINSAGGCSSGVAVAACGRGGDACDSCDDGYSYSHDACIDFTCTHTYTCGVPDQNGLLCNDGNACTDDVCTDSGCVHLVRPDGYTCSEPGGQGVCLDGECCIGFIADAADGGGCVSCDDGNPCTWDHGEDGCDTADMPSGTECPGGVCDGNGACAEPSPTACQTSSECPTNWGSCWYSMCVGGGCAAVTRQDGTVCPGGTCVDGDCKP